VVLGFKCEKKLNVLSLGSQGGWIGVQSRGEGNLSKGTNLIQILVLLVGGFESGQPLLQGKNSC
jgi:hypothetical protein